ncbi:MAG: AmmeMemoRadiSam system protein B [Candidatus Aminicenantes bacterium]|nr:AmmeMemoRadiSam system protein B [Candidatus Aminicenantes bacterium]
MVRQSVVAGMFYPGDKKTLERDLERLIQYSNLKKRVMGLISPHAGYVYSGSCAGKGFGYVDVPESVIIIGVNHRGIGHPFAVDGSDHWNTPLGDCPVDTELRAKLIAGSDVFAKDSQAGLEEHSVEVQVPFIQTINPDAKILPITVSSMDFDELMIAGSEIANCLKDVKNDVLLVASTDMSHYIEAGTAEKEDHRAIEKISALDPEGLFEVVVERRISMCGMSATAIMLKAAVELGATRSELVEYTHSGKVSGDYNQVVAYLSLIVY